jgi:uncharacterized protein (DUF1499 family)
MAIMILSSILAACAGDRPTHPGEKGGVLAVCPSSPNCVSSQVKDERHRIAPLSFRGDPSAAFARLEQVLIQVRSASRLGYSDLGKNRRRLEEIRRAFAGTEATP